MKIEFTDSELRDIPNTISITRDIGLTHFGLGNRAAFLKLVDIANMGAIEVGVSGIGKTKTLKALESIAHKKVFTKKFTLAASTKKMNDYFSNSQVTWLSYELEDMSDMVFQNMMAVVSDLISEHYCDINTKHYHCNIENAYISWIGACTYELYNQIWMLPKWRGTMKDRVLRYFAFSFKRKNINIADPKAHLDMNSPQDENMEMDMETGMFDSVVTLLESQFTSERSFEYATRLLKASAQLNDRSVVKDVDAKFILLHSSNIEAEKWASTRQDLSSPLRLETKTLQLFGEALKRNGVSIKQLAKREGLENESSILKSILSRPNLFQKMGDWVFPNIEMLSEKILPQIEFERLCVTYDRVAQHNQLV